MSVADAVNAIAEVAQTEARIETNPDAPVEETPVEQVAPVEEGQDPGEPVEDEFLDRNDLLEKLRGTRKENERFRKKWQPISEAFEPLGEENAGAVLEFATLISSDAVGAAEWALNAAKILAGDDFNRLAEQFGIPVRVDGDKPAGQAPDAKPGEKPVEKIDPAGDELMTQAEAMAMFQRMLDEREQARVQEQSIASQRAAITDTLRELGYGENDPLLPSLLQIAGTKLGASHAERIKSADAELKRLLEAKGLEVVKAKAADAAGVAGAPDGAAPAGRNLSVSPEEAMEARMDRTFGPRRRGFS